MPFTSNRLLRYLGQQTALVALTAVTTRVGWLFIGIDSGVSWLWPQAGLGLAALALLGIRAWPALLIGGAIGHQWAESVGSTPVLLLASVNTLESLVGALILRHWPGFRTELSRLRDAFALVVAAACAATLGALGATGLIAAHVPAFDSFGRAFATWLVGHGMGVLVVAPPLLSWSRYRATSRPSPARLVEIGGLCLALAAAGMVAYFASVRVDVHSPLEYLPFPVAIWAAMRFGVRGATAATLLMSGVALAGHLLLEPPGTAAPSEAEMLLIQASLAVGALTALLVGAVTTERDETMRALGESEQRATALFAQAPDAIFILDGEKPHVGRLIAANPAAADLYGMRPEELEGRHLVDFDTVTPRTEIVGALNRIVSGERIRTEITHARRDGARVDVEMHASAFEVGGHRYLLAFDRDVTSRKTAEAERKLMEVKLQETQKLESLGLLAGGIAHDFNNLLTGILGNANLARGEDTHPEIEPYLDQIERSAERAADLCGQMLAYAGKARFEVQQVDLSTAVDDTTVLIRSSVGKHVTLDLALARDLPSVEGDLTQVRQIIMNLVLNASEAIEDRPGRIRITTGTMAADRNYLAATHLAPDLPPGRYVFLEVSDTGRGMSRETQARIFDPFFSTKFTGRGLGLAAVLGIVRSHRGALRVESEEGRGSTFRLLLPASPVSARADAATRTPAQAWRGSGVALVIDDEPAVRHVAQRMLATFGLEVVTAASGQEGLAKLRERPNVFAVVLLDLTMPGMSGDETYQHLRTIRTDLPVVLMSGFSHQEAAARFDGHVLAGFLQKPFRLERLREIVRDAVAHPAGGASREVAAGASG
jgi:PAS domain S-box-containing protein